IPYLAIASAHENGPFPYIPLSPELWVAHQTAALTALAFAVHARPRARLCTGRLCLLGNGMPLVPPDNVRSCERGDAIGLYELPRPLRHYALTPDSSGQMGNSVDEQALLDLAHRSTRVSVTCLSGTADRLLLFLAHARRVTGRDSVSDIWPQL